MKLEVDGDLEIKQLQKELDEVNRDRDLHWNEVEERKQDMMREGQAEIEALRLEIEEAERLIEEDDKL